MITFGAAIALPVFATCFPSNKSEFKLATKVLEVIANVPAILTDPATSNFAVGLVVPIPTLPPYCANLTTPVSNTSILGMPETSLTELEVKQNFNSLRARFGL